MADASHSITVDVPIAAVYQQWLDVESFPAFVPGVRSVTVTADIYSHWTVSVGKLSWEFDIEITEQLPEDRIAWRSITAGVALNGRTTFEAAGEDATTVTLDVAWTPDNAAQRTAAALGADDRAIRGVLRAFKSYVEKTGGPAGHSYVTLPSVDPA